MLDVSEMESEFGNDLDFLMARVSCCVEDKSVSEQYVVCVCVRVCVCVCVHIRKLSTVLFRNSPSSLPYSVSISRL